MVNLGDVGKVWGAQKRMQEFGTHKVSASDVISGEKIPLPKTPLEKLIDALSTKAQQHENGQKIDIVQTRGAIKLLVKKLEQQDEEIPLEQLAQLEKLLEIFRKIEAESES